MQWHDVVLNKPGITFYIHYFSTPKHPSNLFVCTPVHIYVRPYQRKRMLRTSRSLIKTKQRVYQEKVN